MVSILLAVYNGEKYIKKSIDSILNQTYTDFELLIGFNGTIDQSKNIVNEYKDDRIKIFDYGMDSGKSKTLNKMLKHANGEWIAIQDDDDIWIQTKLDIQMKYADTGQFDVIGTKIFYCNEEDIITGEPNLYLNHDEILSSCFNGDNQIANTSAIFKKEDTLFVKGWDENIIGIEDFDFWFKLIKKGCRFINIPTPLVLHRIHNGSNFNIKRYDINHLINRYR